MANLSVLVSLGPTNNPVLTVSPDPLTVSAGSNVITWTVNPASPIQGFTFSALNFGPNTPPCFTNLGISNPQISIEDTFTNAANPYEYFLAVIYNSRIYSTPPLAASGTAATPRVDGMGSPTIHNK
jgi:hypothetical protein